MKRMLPAGRLFFAENWAATAMLIAAVSVSACGGSGTDSAPDPSDPPSGDPTAVVDGYSVTLRGGTTDVGSGRLGLALLATVRNSSGRGPLVDWPGSLYGPAGYIATGNLTYSAPGLGSYSTWTWPGTFVEAPTDFNLKIGSDYPTQVMVPFSASPATGLGLPFPHLSADGQKVEWAAVPGAASYRCTIGGAGYATGVGTSCDLSGVPAASYLVAIQAFSIDLVALGANTSPSPLLPARFDVSEGRIGVFVPEGGGTRTQLRAAGGSVRLGTTDFLAVWVSITEPDGTPTSKTWTLYVALQDGSPNNSAGWSPYPAGTSHALLLGTHYFHEATPGDYLLSAYDGTEWMYAQFTVGAPPQLAEVTDVVATGADLGAASVSWTASPGASAYMVRAFDAYGNEADSEWTTATSSAFPSGTFVSGRSYDVYVVATTADVLGGAVPTQVGAVENWAAATFTAP